jgi:hypothetical protein
MTIPEERRALEISARRSRCRVRSSAVAQTVTGPRVAGRVECPDGWAAARFLVAASLEDARTAGARDLALSLRSRAPSDRAFARAVHAFILEQVAFVREHGEVFSSPSYTLAAGGGDCDDHARVAFALLRAGGVPARLAFMHRAGAAGPSHVLAQALVDGEWQWLETTVPAEFGEHPYAAAARLGLLKGREDLAGKMQARTMTEKDLDTVPRGYSGGGPALVALDVRALAALGYLCDDSPADPNARPFREAVATFQRHRGITVDGLTGPQTRGELAAALEDAGMGDLASDLKASTFTHAQAREILRGAYVRLFGHEPTGGELDFGLATAFAETGYGRAGSADWAHPGQFARWASEGLYNWGALEMGNPPCKEGSIEFRGRYRDRPPVVGELRAGVDAGRPSCFLLFDSDDTAAEAFLRTWGAPDTLAAAASGDARAVAAAMRVHGYYEGFWRWPALDAAHPASKGFKVAGSAEEAEANNINDYASLLTRNVRAVRGGGGIPDPRGSTLGRTAAVIGVVAVGLAALYFGWRS